MLKENLDFRTNSRVGSSGNNKIATFSSQWLIFIYLRYPQNVHFTLPPVTFIYHKLYTVSLFFNKIALTFEKYLIRHIRHFTCRRVSKWLIHTHAEQTHGCRNTHRDTYAYIDENIRLHIPTRMGMYLLRYSPGRLRQLHRTGTKTDQA